MEWLPGAVTSSAVNGTVVHSVCSYSPDIMRVAGVLNIISSGLTLVGSLACVIVWMCYRRRAGVVDSLVVNLLGACFVCGVLFVDKQAQIFGHHYPLVWCKINGAALLGAFNAVWLFSLFFAVNLLMELSERPARRRGSAFVAIGWLVPVALGTLLLAANKMGRTTYQWCSPIFPYNYIAFNIPMNFCLWTTVVVYVIIIKRIRDALRRSGNYASRERAIIAKATRRFHLLVVPLFLCYFPLMMAIVSKAVRASGCPAPWIFVLENAMIPLQGFFVSLVYSYNANLRWEIMARCCGDPREKSRAQRRKEPPARETSSLLGSLNRSGVL